MREALPVEQRVIEILAEQFGRDRGEITRSTSFAELAADSLDIVEVVMEIEDVFDLPLPDEVAEKIQTVGDLIDWIIDRDGDGDAGVLAKLPRTPPPPGKGHASPGDA